MSGGDIDAELARQASEQERDKEVERIMQTFQLDAYSVLGLQPGCSQEDINKTYRKKSLLIHPDKAKHTQAPDAFNRLDKAKTALADDKTREWLDQAFADARRLLAAQKKYKLDDERLKSEEFLEEWREKTKQVLIEDELRKRKLEKIQMEEEGRLKRQQEEEEEKKRAKRKRDDEWEQSRDSRVDSWRKYQKSQERKKKKKKQNVLG